MKLALSGLLITLLVVGRTSAQIYTFPSSFKFGAASASYQIEGAWNEDGKSENIWDRVTHKNPNYTADGLNGDTAADSYHMYQKDIDALDNIKFEVYRFSISWSRILPDGSNPNAKGIEYYNKLIDGLIAKNIEPLVTIFHWDLPQYIQDLGGWTNPMIADYFREYADVLFASYGDRVKNWITVNEPSVYCGEGYGYTTKAPAIASPGVGDYLCAHNTLLAHAAAYHLYQDKYASTQKGKVGICLNAGMTWPNTNSSADISAAARAIEFDLGKFANPIFSKEGGYPQVMIDLIGNKSRTEERAWSRLPEMTREVQSHIQGTADFLALNYYSSGKASDRPEDPNMAPSWWADTNTNGHRDPSWVRAKSEWLYSVPEGLHDLLVHIRDQYDNVTVMITENGWSDDGQLDDDGRVLYLKQHLASLSRAINNEKCNVIAYTVWSLTDNFEWKMGYTERFGIHYIDFTSTEKTRVPKKSAEFFKEFMKTKSLDLTETTAVPTTTASASSIFSTFAVLVGSILASTLVKFMKV